MNGFINDIKNNFIATGVGSLPFVDVNSAVNFVFDTFDFHIPFWPQLPKRSFYENMYVQFSEGFPGIKIDEASKNVWVDTGSAQYLEALEECFNKTQAVDVDYFSISKSYAEGLHLFSQRLMGVGWQGWVKAQLIGPLSLGLSLLDEKKNPIIFNQELGELLPLFLSLKAAWLVRTIKVHAKTKVIIFIDEPYLVAVGTSQCSLPRAEIIEKINQVVRVIHDGGALAGIHCCGNTDWELIMSTEIDILNFDAYGYMDKLLLYEKSLEAFLERGSLLALGIVSTNEEVLVPDFTQCAFDRLKKHSRLFKNGAIITTSCGCSGLSESATVFAHNACVELAERLRAEFQI